MPKYGDVQAVLKKAIENLDGHDRQLATNALNDVYRMMVLGRQLAAAQNADQVGTISTEIESISSRFHD